MADALWLRDASERAGMLASAEDAIKLLASANKWGDIDLERAVKARAREEGWDLSGRSSGEATRDVARQLHIDAEAIVTDHKRASQTYIADVDKGRISADFAVEKLGSEYRDRLQALKAKAEKNVAVKQQALDAALSRATGTPSGTPEAQLLAEIRAGKAWDRMQRELPTIKNPGQYFADKITKGTPDDFRAVIDEAPSYLASIGIPEAQAFIDDAVETKFPAIKDAQAALKAAGTLQLITRHNVDLLTDRVSRLAPSTSIEPMGSELKDIGYVNPTEVK